MPLSKSELLERFATELINVSAKKVYDQESYCTHYCRFCNGFGEDDNNGKIKHKWDCVIKEANIIIENAD